MMDKEKMNESELGTVSGGLIFNATNISGSNPDLPWVVIDNKNGNVLNRFRTKAEAEACAQSYGNNAYNTMEIDWNALVSLRNNPIA